MNRIKFAAPVLPVFTMARCTLFAALYASCCGGALAQQVPDRLPPSVEPGRELRQPQPLQPIPDGATLLLANDLHGIQVRGTLQPSASEHGASTLVGSLTFGSTLNAPNHTSLNIGAPLGSISAAGAIGRSAKCA